MLQAYVGASKNDFYMNEVEVGSEGLPKYMIYCAVMANENSFWGNRLSGPAGRAYIAVESAFNSKLRRKSHRGYGLELVNLINRYAPMAVGLSGEDAGLFTARPKLFELDGEEIDLGQVGEVASVDPDAILDLIDSDRVPVVATVAPGPGGLVYNINADTAAAALAVALRAERLVMLTDVAGLYADWPSSTELITQLSSSELRAMMPGLASGMRPKMEACLHAVESGVSRATIIDGRVEHALLLEIFTNEGTGTMVTRDEQESGDDPA